MAPPPLILIPPSEGKAPGGDGPPWRDDAMSLPLGPQRRKVLTALVAAMGDESVDLEKLLGVKGDALRSAVLANRRVRRSPTRPAIERYTGVLYDALDLARISARDRRRLNTQVLIASGAFGLVAPSDPIPDYKLKMGATLPGLGKLSSMWRPHIDAILTPLVGGRTVWNLWPNEHAAAWRGAGAAGLEVTVRFLDDVESDDGSRRLVAVSHWNKLLKGALVRHVLATQLDDPAGLARFDHPLGYRYRPDLEERAGNRVAVAMVVRR